MRFKVGDRVRIKSLDWYNENKDEDGNIRYRRDGAAYPIFFTKYMSRFCGETLTIKCVHKESYYMNETGSCEFWTDEMIEGLVEEEKLSQNAKLVSERFSEKVNASEFKYAQDEIMKMLLQGAINIPDGYEFRDENGNVIEAKVITLEKKRPKYPKSYEECCKVLGYSGNYNMILTTDVDNKLFDALYRLKVCRDAYWKLYGEEMGLDKPWKPDWEDEHQEKYIIGSWLGTIQCLEENFISHPLAFPTEEMRDAFYENFKELIEECKELL